MTYWCYSCERYEPVPLMGFYIKCFECAHIYETPEDLLTAYNDMVEELNQAGMSIPPIPWAEHADGIMFCPLCYHDF